ncbi:ankyrin repeat-containing protein at3g12360 [Phtheirospermum japonicum]|uniref:Ankyrin repeat-containing protein at3g12360 n=1 Tax=Phtheirospermum japonicum TaxID=374723 RepID=A0A830CHX5_9LAMI|nr:ankyrin repeat-containing protein at3g12360 [Phtheirospermum japonicum]
MSTHAKDVSDGDIEKVSVTPTSSKNPLSDPSPSPSPSSSTAPALVLSNSGKRIDQAGKKKYVKQVTGRHNDTELHLAAQRGDLAAVKQILDEINCQMVGSSSGADFDQEVAEIRASVVNETNELGETALYTAAEKGYMDVVKELLKHSNSETLRKKNRSMFDPLHIAASQGHHARQGHVDIVKVLLDKDSQLARRTDKKGQTALHMAVKGVKL